MKTEDCVSDIATIEVDHYVLDLADILSFRVPDLCSRDVARPQSFAKVYFHQNSRVPCK